MDPGSGSGVTKGGAEGDERACPKLAEGRGQRDAAGMVDTLDAGQRKCVNPAGSGAAGSRAVCGSLRRAASFSRKEGMWIWTGT